MAGFITYNGLLLLKGNAFAGSTDCCCVSYTCYCFTYSVNYQVAARWKKCYRSPVFDTNAGIFVFPDGQPCDGSTNGVICPPGSVGRFIIFNGIVVDVCGCGGDPPGTGYNATTISTPEQFSICSDVGSPP